MYQDFTVHGLFSDGMLKITSDALNASGMHIDPDTVD